MQRETIARVAHEINRAYCASLGDASQPAWEEAPEWQRASALAGVDMHLANPDATPEQSHESWLAQKVADGWTYGPVKDAEKKQHPFLVPYADLPAEQKAKDYLFRGVVHALKNVPDADALLAENEGLTKKLQSLSHPAPIAAHSVSVTAAAGTDGTPVQYIGRRSEWRDHLYGTGLNFAANQVRNLPEATANVLLRHADLFKVADAADVPVPDYSTVTAEAQDDTAALLEQGKQAEEQQQDQLTKLLDLKQTVSLMDKEALKSFALTNFKQKLDGRLGVEALRSQTLQFLDQFGMP